MVKDELRDFIANNEVQSVGFLTCHFGELCDAMLAAMQARAAKWLAVSDVYDFAYTIDAINQLGEDETYLVTPNNAIADYKLPEYLMGFVFPLSVKMNAESVKIADLLVRNSDAVDEAHVLNPINFARVTHTIAEALGDRNVVEKPINRECQILDVTAHAYQFAATSRIANYNMDFNEVPLPVALPENILDKRATCPEDEYVEEYFKVLMSKLKAALKS